MTKDSRTIYLFLVLIVLSLSLASSQTLIAGKIYNADFSNTLSDINVRVVCNNIVSLDTNTLGDGTYAVRFEEAECSEGNSVSVVASKSGFQEKTGPGTISKCEEADCEEPYVTIINLGMKTQTSSNEGNTGGGGISGRYYLCGNKKCDTGENVITCPGDCKTIELLTQTTETTNNEETTEAGATRTEITEENLSKTTNLGFFPTITGAVTGAIIGTLGTAGTIVVVIFLVVIILSMIMIRVIRKRR